MKDYLYIICPESNKTLNLISISGKQILYRYLNKLQNGGVLAPKLKWGDVQRRNRLWESKKPKSIKDRKNLIKKCGKRCFLIHKKLKYPVCSKNKCEINCDGVRSARNNAAIIINRKNVKLESKIWANTAYRNAQYLGLEYCNWQIV